MRITEQILRQQVRSINRLLNVGDNIYQYDETGKIIGGI